jgi:hypothetical protein
MKRQDNSWLALGSRDHEIKHLKKLLKLRNARIRYLNAKLRLTSKHNG